MEARNESSDLEKRAWAAYERGEMAIALAQFLQLASDGKPYYLVAAARMYMDGEGVTVDLSEAAKLLDQASALGVREALLQRAECAARRDDDREYFLLVSQAERAGLISARYLLGLCHIHGRGTDRNPAKGLSLMEDAASAGHLGANAFIARQLLKRPVDVIGFARGVLLFFVTAFKMIFLSLANPHDPRLR
jgi:TPR repeat protein